MTDLAHMIGLDQLTRRVLAFPEDARAIVAIAGAPGSGKSTLARRLVAAVNETRPNAAALLPMDGFHYDARVLDAFGRRARKGAPDTFDVGGLRHMLARLRARDEAEVAIPLFDRKIEISRAGAELIVQSVRLVVVEGNYLLLRDPPWGALHPLFDLTVLIVTPEITLRQRLTRRWQHFGLSPDQITRKIDGNDLPNGRRVMTRSVAPDFRLRN